MNHELEELQQFHTCESVVFGRSLGFDLMIELEPFLIYVHELQL